MQLPGTTYATACPTLLRLLASAHLGAHSGASHRLQHDSLGALQDDGRQSAALEDRERYAIHNAVLARVHVALRLRQLAQLLIAHHIELLRVLVGARVAVVHAVDVGGVYHALSLAVLGAEGSNSGSALPRLQPTHHHHLLQLQTSTHRLQRLGRLREHQTIITKRLNENARIQTRYQDTKVVAHAGRSVERLGGRNVLPRGDATADDHHHAVVRRYDLLHRRRHLEQLLHLRLAALLVEQEAAADLQHEQLLAARRRRRRAAAAAAADAPPLRMNASSSLSSARSALLSRPRPSSMLAVARITAPADTVTPPPRGEYTTSAPPPPPPPSSAPCES
mmetsp:Transcript_26728/g.64980  ORF Transcript_26728/g.64980 Transcript_26728/m.64980 type:complete len:336 (-) Transcript_26728:1-1008(-)